MTETKIEKIKEYLSWTIALKDAMRRSLDGEDSNVWSIPVIENL